MSVLERIIQHKKKEVEELKKQRPLDETVFELVLYPSFSFSKAISRPERLNIIAELKRASPSLGLIRPDFDPVKIARIYAENDASAISVITDKKFFVTHYAKENKSDKFISREFSYKRVK
jgi:indole-3-glycerol phosphate synthase